ncbi:Predicted amidophosphoribosyltransferases [Modestobacter sp. DSM 44400]|uniref:ComF family protein n=1 Tax=Modestobacter sp. DSM 44400 TaxID=1550230 RepID=UPI00089D6E1D|nr:ComF family protein [Modestobacter sp. DSM 44400]SDX48777.1 Predicted amidophosphoribosyltransferases [Modestobacter sp. DSM 44400]
MAAGGGRVGRPAAGALVAGWTALADLVLPRTCAGCAVPGDVLCPDCRGRLAEPRLAEPRRHPDGFPPTVAAGAYSGPVRPAVLAFKEHGRAELATPLGRALALAVTGVLAGLPGAGRGRPVLLVPVPSSTAAVQRRGRDHVGELARAAATELRAAGLAARPAALLRRPRGTRDSAGLDAAARRANLAGRFAVRAPRDGPPVGAVLVLVDDVVSSGATLTEAARALAAGLSSGNEPVLAAVVAATPRRSGHRVAARSPGTFTVRT